ncbi:unnamed protein product [Cylindrotheca closterium]|uniref:Protein transport protein SEC23 n=1 Tax=Cylindrotheca closterium TaxID=2856 RepID=A0AAD2FT35_9STRA|nr:unnamed protein product [Cylindrotheca closterium]
MTSTIRPISKRFPQSKSLWDETNLPMCAVLTPLGGMEKLSTSGKQEQQPDQAQTQAPLKLANLIRCLKCGAPHPTIDTYDLLEEDELIFCHLCGAPSSYNFEEQAKIRTHDGLKEMAENGEEEDWPFIADERKPKGDILVDLPLFNEQDYFSESAKACPPVWWIVLDGTMPQSSPYWKTVTDSLHAILLADDGEDGGGGPPPPEYAHIGLLLASQDTLSTWDLSSPVPRVSHYPLEAAAAATEKKSTDEHLKIPVDLNLTPIDPLYEPSVQATLRAVSDNPSLKDNVGNTNSAETGMALGATIETILEFMEQAKHPGDTLEGGKDEMDSTLLYAGGKITCLLGRPPLEIEPLDREPQSHFGMGGMGGGIHDAMHSDKFAQMPDVHDSSDLTPTNLASYCKPLRPTEDIFDIIGTRCAHAALGVDIVVVEDNEPTESNRHFIRPFYGLPLLRVLSDTSGAPGPLMIDNSVDLTHQVRVRTPWQPGMAFATEMRVRTSPGWGVETSPIESIPKATHQMAIFLSSSGVSGPAIATNDNFFLLGTCDKHTSVTLDLQNTDPRRHVKLEQKLYGLRGRVGLKVMLKPVMQTCIAYTCIEGSSGRVVRRMKISYCPMPMATDVESIYNSIDPEALAAALFHKLALNVYEEGTVSTQQVGIDWLKTLLVCVYQSALNVLENEGKKKLGMPNYQETQEEYRRNPFDASLRVLTSSGDQIMTLSPRNKGDKKSLEVDDVLLGQGHRRVASLALVVFSLLQSDALRPSPGVSADARCAAIANMASMTPRDLVKCIAPSLSLWSSKDDAPVARSIDLSLMEAIKTFKRGAAGKKGDLIFVLDSPQQLLVYKGSLKAHEETKKFKLGLKPYVPKSPKLMGMIQAMTSSYRVKPFTTLDSDSKSETASFRRFIQNMIEDMPTADPMEGEGSGNFKHWKSDMAQLVQAELEELGLLGS